MSKTVTLIYASGQYKEITVVTNATSVIIPSDKSTYPPQDTLAQIEQFEHKGKIYWFARESREAISKERVACVLLNIQ